MFDRSRRRLLMRRQQPDLRVCLGWWMSRPSPITAPAVTSVSRNVKLRSSPKGTGASLSSTFNGANVRFATAARRRVLSLCFARSRMTRGNSMR